jgi:hypothetical protein
MNPPHHCTPITFAEILDPSCNREGFFQIEGIVASASARHSLHDNEAHKIWNVLLYDGKHSIPLTCVTKCEAQERQYSPLEVCGTRVRISHVTVRSGHNKWIYNGVSLQMSLSDLSQLEVLPFHWLGSEDLPGEVHYTPLHMTLFFARCYYSLATRRVQPRTAVSYWSTPPRTNLALIFPLEVWKLVLKCLKLDRITQLMLYYTSASMRRLLEEACPVPYPPDPEKPLVWRYRYNTSNARFGSVPGTCSCCLKPDLSMSGAAITKLVSPLCVDCSVRECFQLAKWPVSVPVDPSVVPAIDEARGVGLKRNTLYWKKDVPEPATGKRRKRSHIQQ